MIDSYSVCRGQIHIFIKKNLTCFIYLIKRNKMTQHYKALDISNSIFDIWNCFGVAVHLDCKRLFFHSYFFTVQLMIFQLHTSQAMKEGKRTCILFKVNACVRALILPLKSLLL